MRFYTPPTNKKTAEKKLSVYIVYDRSGSMASRQDEAVTSTNEYVKALDPNTRVTLVAFDDTNPHDLVIDNALVKDYVNLTVDRVYARGMTPLFDAVGWTIDRMLNVDKPDRAILVVQTDGLENNSKEYNHSAITSKIENIKAKGFQVVFLGSEFKDVGSISKSFKLDLGSTINRTKGNYGEVSMSLAASTRSYLSGASKSIEWSDADKKALGDNS